MSFNSAGGVFPALKGKERYRTKGFRETAHFTGVTDSSFRITTRRLNRTRRQPGATPVKFIQEGAEREGGRVALKLKEQSADILTEHGFQADGSPVNDELKLLVPFRPSREGETKTAFERVMTNMPEGITVEELKRNILKYEDAEEAVNISVDDVLTKRQKSVRAPAGDSAAEEKKRIYNNVIHIQTGTKRYIFNTPKLRLSLPILLGILINNDLLGRPLRFFTDGERSLKTNIFKFFAWHSNVHLILDWYHLSEKCRQCVSLTMKGNKNEKRAIVKQLRTFLWYGLIDQAINYINSLDDKHFKLLTDRTYLIGYLERNREHIPCYAIRKELGLKNGSQMGEKSNDILIADRQKHNGMSWSSEGSESLGCLTAVRFNGELEHWLTTGELTMRLKEVENDLAA